MGEDMFKDLALSKELMSDYHSKLPEESAGRKLSVMVLQRSVWPFSVQKATVDLPPNVRLHFSVLADAVPLVLNMSYDQMQAELTAYASYYKQRHSGHTLDWDHGLGTVTMIAQFNAGSKELSVSLYQAVILLLFNESTEWRYPDVLEQTRMG